MPNPVRTIYRIANTQGTNLDDGDTPIQIYSGEKVKLTVEVRRGNVIEPLPESYSVKWRAWLSATPETLYIDKAGTVTGGKAVVELDPDETAMDAGTYDFEVRIYDGTSDMGVVLSGTAANSNGMEILYAVPSAGVSYVGTVPAYPNSLPDLDDVTDGITPTLGKILVGNGTAWNTLAIGSASQVLTVSGGTAAWANAAGVSDGDKGDITVSGTGATWTIDDAAVTLAKIQDIGSGKLIGRHTAGAGVPQEVGIDGGLEFQGSNIQRSALTGDVTASAGSNATTISAGAVSTSKLGGDITTAGKAILDDATAADQLTTLGAVAKAGDTMTGGLTIDGGDGDGIALTFHTNAVGSGGPSHPHVIGAILGTNPDVLLGTAAEITVETNSSADAGIVRLTSNPSTVLELDGSNTGTLTLTGGQYVGDATGLTNIPAGQLTGTVAAARLGNVNHRCNWTSMEAFLVPSGNVGYSQYNHASRAISVFCAKSATASLQSATIRFPAKRVPFGFAAFKETGAITLKYLGDSTSASDIKITGITLYGTDLTTGSETTLYTDSTARTPGTADAVTAVSIDRSAFSSTTVTDYLIAEVSVQVANSKQLGVLSFEVNAE